MDRTHLFVFGCLIGNVLADVLSVSSLCLTKLNFHLSVYHMNTLMKVLNKDKESLWTLVPYGVTCMHDVFGIICSI